MILDFRNQTILDSVFSQGLRAPGIAAAACQKGVCTVPVPPTLGSGFEERAFDWQAEVLLWAVDAREVG